MSAGGETRVNAAVLLDAAHPGVTPALLPGMKPVPGYPGIVKAPSSGGELVAHSIPSAWLVVEATGEGRSALQRPLRVLEHLRATIHL
jgi:hypothetical protein